MGQIEISGLQIDAIIGVLEREQRQTQRIEADLTLELPLGPAGDHGALEQSVDYAAIADQVRFIAEHGRFRLLESLAVAALRLVLLPPAPGEGRAKIQRAEITLRKPEVLAGICVPGVRMARDSSFAPASTPIGEGIEETRLVSVLEGQARRLVLPKGAQLPATGEAIWVISGEVEAGGRWGPGTRLARGVALQVIRDAALLVVGQAGR